jgi:hypothetical protein
MTGIPVLLIPPKEPFGNANAASQMVLQQLCFIYLFLVLNHYIIILVNNPVELGVLL